MDTSRPHKTKPSPFFTSFFLLLCTQVMPRAYGYVKDQKKDWDAYQPDLKHFEQQWQVLLSSHLISRFVSWHAQAQVCSAPSDCERRVGADIS